MKSALGCGLIWAIVGLVSAADFTCNGEESYDYPVEGDCRLYHACSQGSSQPTLKGCSWFFHNFDPVTLRCNWCWKVDCSATPAPPPTIPPTTIPITTSTEAPTSPSTARPSSSTAATQTATAATQTATAATQTATAATQTGTAGPSSGSTKAAKGKSMSSFMLNRLEHL